MLSFLVMPCFTSAVFRVIPIFNSIFFTGVFAPLCICKEKYQTLRFQLISVPPVLALLGGTMHYFVVLVFVFTIAMI